MGHLNILPPLMTLNSGALQYGLYDGSCLNPSFIRLRGREFWDEEDARRFLASSTADKAKTMSELRNTLIRIGIDNVGKISDADLTQQAGRLLFGKRIVAIPMDDSAALKSSHAKWYPPAASKRIPPNNDDVLKWLCRAVKSQKGNYLPAYSYLSYARTLGLDRNDPNLIAAERYMEGYEGNYSRGWILLQDFAKKAGIHGGGSKSEDSEFITTWGFMGVDHREENLPIGGHANTTNCVCNRYT